MARVPLLALAAVAMLAPLAAACGGGEPEEVASRGRVLNLVVSRPQITEKLAFVDLEGRHRILRPRASNRQLALIDVTVINTTSTVVPMVVDAEAAQLGDRRGERIEALDPFEAARILDGPDPDEGKYAPLLWGEIQLDRNFQVSGWMVFDVPKGLVLGTFWWNQVDLMLADYIDYYR